MDGFPEKVQQTYRAKKPTNQVSKGKAETKAGTSKPNKKDDLASIGKATGNDVCVCVQLLAEYIKETIKLLCCCNSDYGTKFTTLFCELGETTMNIFSDIYSLIKHLVLCVLCMGKSEKKKKK
ncbi:hypothetical protein NE865_15537 [Phthorimaea operculella]|nr:hypothetical protein NE865_15537 [Phthorimaea operculella]